MIGTVKKWLGIEGVKLELILDEDAAIQPGMVSGLIRFTSMHSQVVTKVKVVLIEKYSRGRGKEKRVDEYELGNLELQEDIEVIAGEEVDVEFTLKYKLVRSEMDELEKSNFLMSPLVKLAKRLSAVQSEYRIVAEAKVKGTALNPFDSKEVIIK
ncbi:MAG: sporulation protein [Haliscomenobacter sp.]|uniref:sporulation protein n=1 Tax=Haliscomenobacter sp. TaxID=2717303 RepID=UPI0029A87C29|nr:sporulation protein [Haliscomenobacter sp.]MDX2072480.1 sporulation protein [Haliscomenobacter sp.]